MVKGHDDDTIVAMATPAGEGAIAVIRASGTNAITAIDSIFQGTSRLTEARSHTAHYGRLLDLQGLHVDDVVATVFRSPRSYTGEDVVEVSCHGGVLNTQRVLETIMSAGARQAYPGEFTKRAFLNGKMDLAQAEAVAALIAAKSESARRASVHQLEGKFSSQISELRSQLLDVGSLLELELDFSEEGLDLIQRSDVLKRITDVRTSLQTMINSYRLGKVYRDGVSVVIVGKPNAGKSSLFNALLRESRAIVTEIPGTTRDSLEESISIDGILFRLSDTAGLRETGDRVEQQGVMRARSLVKQADILVVVVDSTTMASSEDVLSFLAGLELPEKVLIAYNKIDLCTPRSIQLADFRVKGTAFGEVQTSALTGEGLDSLRRTFVESLAAHDPEATNIHVTNGRHHRSLVAAHEALSAALQAVEQERSGEFVASDIRSAANYLAEIIGEVTTDDLLNNIFHKFCIGK